MFSFPLSAAEAAAAMADAVNLANMHPARLPESVRQIEEASRLPDPIEFRAVDEQDWLSIRLLLDDATDFERTFEQRHGVRRVHEAVAIMHSEEAVGYCGLDTIREEPAGRAHRAFSYLDAFDRRSESICAAMAKRLDTWLA